MEKRTHYQVLGVQSDATQEQIKNAFRRLAKQYHPDVNKTKEAEEIMKEVTLAYEVLSDIEKRKRYDLDLERQSRSSSQATQKSYTQRQTTYQTYTQRQRAYDSYTKTKEESEFDFDEIIRDILRNNRNNSQDKFNNNIKYNINDNLKHIFKDSIKYNTDDDGDIYQKVKVLKR